MGELSTMSVDALFELLRQAGYKRERENFAYEWWRDNELYVWQKPSSDGKGFEDIFCEEHFKGKDNNKYGYMNRRENKFITFNADGVSVGIKKEDILSLKHMAVEVESVA